MQFQSDICRCPVVRPNVLETTALGAAYLAGLAIGYWKDIDELKEQWCLPAFDTVVNTVPAQVLSAEVLARLRPESLIVDLASRPGGTDFEAARRLGHRAIHALSLPAACAPETAGEAVAQTVCEMIGQREEA